MLFGPIQFAVHVLPTRILRASGCRYPHHQAIDIGRVHTENARSAAVRGEHSGGDAASERSYAQARAVGGLGQGLELAAGVGRRGHECLLHHHY